MISFVTGEFQKFRAVRKVHLGSMGRDLNPGQVILFDGQTMKLGSEIIPYDGLNAAIRAEWVVLDQDSESTYTPRDNDIQITPAQMENPNEARRSKMSIQTVSDEQRVVGSLEGFNQRKETATRLARTDQGGIPIGEVQVSDGGINSNFLIDNPVGEERKKFAIVQEDEGDKIVRTVEGAMKTEPRKISPARTKTTVTPDRIVVSSEDEGGTKGKTEVLESQEGTVVQTRKITTKTRQEWVQGEGRPDPLPNTPTETVRSAKTTKTASPETPKFTWDVTAHWQTRVKRALAYQDQPEKFRYIISVEKPNIVEKILERADTK